MEKIISETIMAFFKDETGVSAVEYGLLVALIGAVLIATVTSFGQISSDIFVSTTTAISASSTAQGGAGSPGNTSPADQQRGGGGGPSAGGGPNASARATGKDHGSALSGGIGGGQKSREAGHHKFFGNFKFD